MQTREITQEQDREVKARELLEELQSFVRYWEGELKELFVKRAETISAQERSLRAQRAISGAREFLKSARKFLLQLDVAADEAQERKAVFDAKHGMTQLETE